MSDFIDETNDREEHVTALRIESLRHQPPVAQATGHCLYCDEPVAEPRRWCNRDCAALWERER